MSADTSMRYGASRLEIPSGFGNILWLISQEAMRANPDNLLQFISGFLDDLVNIRESKICIYKLNYMVKQVKL